LSTVLENYRTVTCVSLFLQPNKPKNPYADKATASPAPTAPKAVGAHIYAGAGGLDAGKLALLTRGQRKKLNQKKKKAWTP